MLNEGIGVFLGDLSPFGDEITISFFCIGESFGIGILGSVGTLLRVGDNKIVFLISAYSNTLISSFFMGFCSLTSIT